MALVLFVCKENSYRSQIAEAIFNSVSKKDFAISASGAEPAKEVSPEAIALLKSRYGIDMSGQRPKMLTEDMLKSASRIITVCDPTIACFSPKATTPSTGTYLNSKQWTRKKRKKTSKIYTKR